MIKFRAALAVAGVLVLAAGCSSTSSSDSSTPVAPESSAPSASASMDGGEPTRITYIPGVQGDAFFATSVCGAQDAAAENNVDLDVQVPAEFSAQAEVPIITAVIASKPDGMIVFPDDPVGVTAALKQAQDEGIEVHTLSADVEDTSARSFNLKQDLGIGGTLAGEEMAKLLGNEGATFVINVKPGIGTTDAREAGFKAAIEAVPGMTYVGQRFGNNDPTESAKQVTAALQANPEIKGIYATNIFAGLGAITALKQMDLAGKVRLIVHDTAPEEVEALESGLVDGLIATNAYSYGHSAVEAMLQSLDGQEPSVELPEEVFVTKANLNDPDIQRQYIYKNSCS